MCNYIGVTQALPGFGCCRCHTYNGLQRDVCRSCGIAPCAFDVPPSLVRCAECGFGFRPGVDPAFSVCPVCHGAIKCPTVLPESTAIQ